MERSETTDMALIPGGYFGAYEIISRLGSGGMGEVWRVRDPRLEREVALKVLPATTLVDDKAQARMLREARMAARLNHPNVCAVHEVGEAEGQVYITMELVDGSTLSERLEAGPLPAEEVMRLGLQLAEGLAHAHERGVVHRDFKSGNVIVTPEGRAKVLDFGLAKPLDRAETAEATTLSGASVTRAGTVVGTPAYMAPEQLRGQAADERSDVWALGVVLFEMVDGKRPFSGTTSFELSSAILNDRPSPLPEDVPAVLASIINRCLAKEPGRRYQRAGEVRSALEALQTGDFTAPRPKLRVTLTPRSRALALAVLAIAATLAGVSALDVGGLRHVLFPQISQRPNMVRMAVLPFVNLSGDPEQAYFADGFTQEMITHLGHLHPESLGVIARTSVMRYKNGDTPVDQIARELGVDFLLEGGAQRDGDRIRITTELIDADDQTQLWANSYERRLEDITNLQTEIAREIARQARVPLTPEQKDSLLNVRPVNPEVYEVYTRGMFYVSQNTEESFEKGIGILHQAVAIDPAEPLAYIGLAEGYITKGHGGGDREEAFQRARAAAEQALKLDPDRAEAVAVLADVALYYEWDWEKAERLFRRALELNSSLAMTHYHYAWYLALFDRLDEAIIEHKAARDLDPLRALHTGWLGQLYNLGGRYEEAVVEADKALDLDPQFWPSFFVLRFAFSRMGRHDEAIDAARRLTELRPKIGTMELITALALAGDRVGALETLAKADLSKSGAGTRGARMFVALEDRNAALDALEASYEMHYSTLPWMRVTGAGLDALRNEPRFQELIRKMNLPE